jgi:small neutral amino acid transporter SnatA (MarC family)
LGDPQIGGTNRRADRANGLHALTRLSGLLLAAIAVEIISTGLRSLFPILV